MTIAKRVRELREAKGWSQTQLAEAATKLGGKLSQQNVANIEAGIVKQPKSLLQIAHALDVSPMWLHTGQGKAEPPPARNQTMPAPDIFLSYSGDDDDEVSSKALIDMLMKTPPGSEKEKAVIGLIRIYLQKGVKALAPLAAGYPYYFMGGYLFMG